MSKDRTHEHLDMNTVTTVALALLAVAAALCFARAVRPGTIIDRAIALDGVVSALICGVAIGAVRTGDEMLVDLALVGGLLGFLTLSTIARYVGRRGL
jgi:multicomponent Na+:H+ antiporter subunit F